MKARIHDAALREPGRWRSFGARSAGSYGSAIWIGEPRRCDEASGVPVMVAALVLLAGP